MAKPKKASSGSVRVWGEGTPQVEAIVAAALAVIDEDGLSALTTRRVADELGMFQPNIYRRIADRDELLGLVADAIVAEAGLPTLDKTRWREWLMDCGLRLHRAWTRHPNAAPLVHRGGTHPAILRLLDEIMEAFLDGGFARERVLGALNAYLGYVFGTILLGTIGPVPSDPDKGFDADLARRFPSIELARQIMREADPRPPRGGAAITAEPAFVDGLAVVLDGLELKRKAPRPRTARHVRRPRA